MIAVLVLERPGRIDQAVLKQEIPVGLDILCMDQADHLFHPTAQHIIQF